MDVGTLDRISARLDEGQVLSDDEARQLAATHDILALGSLADTRRRHRHGTTTTFVRVAEVALPDAMTARFEWPLAAREIRVIGRPGAADEAVSIVRRVVAAAGDLPVSGFSLADLDACSDGDAALQDLLAALKAAGLASIAEAPVDALADPGRSLSAAAQAGLPVARLTVSSPSPAGPLAVMASVAALRAAGVAPDVFAPLPRQQAAEPTTGYEDVKAVALARILLDLPHIQVDWRLHGPKLAQVALTMGADDVDNVSAEDVGPEGRRRSALEEIQRNIRAAGLEPLERDGRFVAVR